MKTFLLAAVTATLSAASAADFDELVKAGDAHDRKFECDKALESYLPAEKLQPRNAALLVSISRQYALRMSDLPKEADKLAAGRKALGYAERAVAAAPGKCDPHLSVAICLGKLTPYLEARATVEASRRIGAEAEKAVALDARSDLAWQVLGRWNQALANTGFATRAMVKVIYGGLPAASNEEAVKCFRKAIALNPDRLVHFIELGRTYAMMGEKERARKYIEQGLAMPDKDKDDPETKRRGRETLKGIS